jgi:hypothetical protein
MTYSGKATRTGTLFALTLLGVPALISQFHLHGDAVTGLVGWLIFVALWFGFEVGRKSEADAMERDRFESEYEPVLNSVPLTDEEAQEGMRVAR